MPSPFPFASPHSFPSQAAGKGSDARHCVRLKDDESCNFDNASGWLMSMAILTSCMMLGSIPTAHKTYSAYWLQVLVRSTVDAVPFWHECGLVSTHHNFQHHCDIKGRVRQNQ